MQHTNYKNRIFLLSIFFIILLHSCYRDPAEHGERFNPIREDIGLPLVKKEWTFNHIQPGIAMEWINPNQNTPCHSSKTVNYRHDKILAEMDVYLGPYTYPTIEGVFHDRLQIAYYFDYPFEKKPNWECHLITSNRETDLFGFEDETIYKLTKHQADSVLIAWKINQ